MSTIWVRFGDHRDYPIVIKPGVLSSVGSLARPWVRGKTACLISHPRIFHYYGKSVMASLRHAGFQVHPILLPEGEKIKTLATAEQVIRRMIRWHIDRQGFILALGGGVIGDLAGWVAAIYMRGIDFIQVPTSLLAQVDSSVGGKVAVNHPLGKNLIGAFLQPRLVLIDPNVLQTLSLRQFRSGLAEIIKSALIADADFFAHLEQVMPLLLKKDPKTLAPAIARSCTIKARIVEQDETDKGLRAILNYGHTLGHALETYHHYKEYLHGEAIAIGMVAAARLALLMGVCQSLTVQRQEKILKLAGLPLNGKGESSAKILRIMKADKKALSGHLNFVLTPKIGSARIWKKILPFSVCRVLKTVLRGT